MALKDPDKKLLPMFYAGALGLLETCSTQVDEDTRESIEQCFADAAANYGYQYRRILDRLEIEPPSIDSEVKSS